MTGRYIAFDVETPNSANNRMSDIGVTVVERGEVVEQYDYLVNPETWFASFNVALTGITPEMVADKPTFPQLWRELEPLFSSGLLVAHNAPFDMSVQMCIRDRSPDGRLVEAVEITGHPFFVGVQFHPEFKSRPNRPHPLFRGFVAAAGKQQGTAE